MGKRCSKKPDSDGFYTLQVGGLVSDVDVSVGVCRPKRES